MSETRLDSLEAVVAALGGPAGLRGLTGQTPQTVWGWRQRGRFPAHTYVRLKGELERLGYEADVKLWGQS